MASDVVLLGQALILGLLMAGVYSLMSSGLTIVFGVMRIINLAHASLIIFSAYIVWYLMLTISMDPIMTAIVILPLYWVIGMFIYKTLLTRMPPGREGITFSVILMFGLALFIDNSLAYTFTTYTRNVDIVYGSPVVYLGPFAFPTSKLIGSIIATVALIILFAFLWRTKLGTALRATIQNRAAAQLVGIDVERISMLAFAIGTLTAGVGGVVLTLIASFSPALSGIWLMRLLAIVVLGGMESFGGVVLGAIILGVSEALIQVFISPSWALIAYAASVFGIFLIRPQGLLGEKTL